MIVLQLLKAFGEHAAEVLSEPVRLFTCSEANKAIAAIRELGRYGVDSVDLLVVGNWSEEQISMVRGEAGKHPQIRGVYAFRGENEILEILAVPSVVSATSFLLGLREHRKDCEFCS